MTYKKIQQQQSIECISISIKVCIGFGKHIASLIACSTELHIGFLYLIYFVCCELLQNFHESGLNLN